MTAWELGLLARAAEATICGGALPKSVEAVGTDTRSLSPNSLFVALRGERFDGHEFVDDALARGASVVLVDQEGAAKLEARGGGDRVPRLVVRDTLVALGDIARAIRDLHGKTVAAVTGSNGKTTTKELMAAALSVGGEVHKTYGNFNNLVGVPLTILAWLENAWAAVVEMGMNAPGEIARLTEIARPDVGLITNVGVAHLEGLGSIEAIARAKGELFAGLRSDTVAVVNIDDTMVRTIGRSLLSGEFQITFGHSNEADVQIRSVKTLGEGIEAQLSVFDAPCTMRLPLCGDHNAMNGVGALAVGLALDLPLDPMLEALASVRIPGGRFKVVWSSMRKIHVVDDTYNANPPSMKAAFSTLRDLANARDNGRRIVALGDMLELGKESEALHREVGRAAAVSGVAWVLATGQFAESVVEGAREAGVEAAAFEDTEALLQELEAGLQAGDWVLAKGSRGARMERVVQALVPEESA